MRRAECDSCHRTVSVRKNGELHAHTLPGHSAWTPRFCPGKPVATECTGLTARWCPIHGKCSCDGEWSGTGLADDDCPLHNRGSEHPLPTR